jgi:multiple antibiotic resistance protein
MKFLEVLIGGFAALFPVTDPVGAIPLFLVLTSGASQQLRNRLALKIACYMLFVLVIFLLIGGSVLSFFGLSIAVVKIAGGIVVFEAGWRALKEKPRITPKDEKVAAFKAEHHEDIAFIPMTVPLLAGPGSIAVTLGLAAQAGRDLSWPTGLNYLAAIGAIALICAITYGCLRLSSRFLMIFGERGITALSRFLGLFILAVGVQLMLNGLADWMIRLGIIK